MSKVYSIPVLLQLLSVISAQILMRVILLNSQPQNILTAIVIRKKLLPGYLILTAMLLYRQAVLLLKNKICLIIRRRFKMTTIKLNISVKSATAKRLWQFAESLRIQTEIMLEPFVFCLHLNKSTGRLQRLYFLF